jgi:adenosylcobyric acid synthase
VFVNRGLVVAPFKAQNMSNNSGVTPEGLEMGRAQIVQAEAARIPPHVDMNPVLLKPTSDVGSQVVVLGLATENRSAMAYRELKERLFRISKEAYARLERDHELIVMEGAGSCAEVNLMDHDFVNFPMADHADAPVILVADIHRGGVFAQVVGSLACLPEKYQERVAGFIINRFRGDVRLFQDGVEWIEKQTGKPVFGVVPWYTHFRVESEDSVVIEAPRKVAAGRLAGPAVAVIRLPHIANFTDFEPLEAVSGLDLFFLEDVQGLEGFQAVLIPGSKNTRADLEWLHQQGWAGEINRFVESGGHILGICGGYQMLGQVVHDLEGLEGTPGASTGLGLLPVETWLEAPKTTTRTHFIWEGAEGFGYEIHMGRTQRLGGDPMVLVSSRNSKALKDTDGCVARGGRILGTYIHGLFDSPAVVTRWLAGIGLDGFEVPDQHGPKARDRDYDLLADHFSNHVDVDAIGRLIGWSP